MEAHDEMSEKIFIIPPRRVRYLSEIADTVRNYNQWTEEQAEIAQKLQALEDTRKILGDDEENEHHNLDEGLNKNITATEERLDPQCRKILSGWDQKLIDYKNEEYVYKVRDNEIRVKTHSESLAHTMIPKVSLIS